MFLVTVDDKKCKQMPKNCTIRLEIHQFTMTAHSKAKCSADLLAYHLLLNCKLVLSRFLRWLTTEKKRKSDKMEPIV